MNIKLLCEKQPNPIAAPLKPRFSWMVEDAHVPNGFVQRSYHIIVHEMCGSGPVVAWNSGEILSDVCTDIVCEVPLQPNKCYGWQVTITDAEGHSFASDSSEFETGIEDWQGKWIGAGNVYKTNWATLHRREFQVHGKIEKVKLYFCGLGAGYVSINGVQVGDHFLDPAITEFRQTLLYSAFDVTDMLQQGGNAIGVELGDGWYHQSLLMDGNGIYGDPCFLLQLEIRYQGGSVQKVLSDESWKVALSPTVYNNIFCGEVYDARMEQKGWNLFGFNDASWHNSVLDNAPKGKLVAQQMPPMRITEKIHPVSVTMPQGGVYVFDMGINFAGIVELATKGTPGREITLRFGEALTPEGMVDVDSTGVFHIQQVQTLRYIFAEEGEAKWKPRFCYFGFRYVEVTGLPFEELGKLSPNAIYSLVGLRVNTDLKSTGSFECSMQVLNQMHGLLKNSMLSNLHGIPTDCPAREKGGWTGDANIICDTLAIMWDSQLFWEKYTQDIVDSRKEYGVYNNIVPGRRDCGETVPPWGAAIAIIPWVCYREYGDKSVLQRHYADMMAYLVHVEKKVENGLYAVQESYPLADWAAPYGYDSGLHFCQTASAYYYKQLCIMYDAAIVLGKTEDAKIYEQKMRITREAFAREYYDFSGHTFGTQTLNAFAEDLGLIPEAERTAAARWTADDIVAHDYHTTSGHIGLRYLYSYLTQFRHFAVLEKMLLSNTYPSFGAQLEMGATSLWETFETSYHDQSLNHFFKGGFGHWMYRDILGIRCMEPGYRKIEIKPCATALVPSAKGGIKTVRGEIWVDYTLGERFEVVVPPNSRADVYVPLADGTYEKHNVGSGKHTFI